MHLPDGVSHRPRERALIAKNRPAIIEIATGKHLANAAYTVRDRFFDSDIAPYLHGDWADLDRVFRLKQCRTTEADERAGDPCVTYSGAEHRATPKLPNITVVPNLQPAERRGLGRPFTVLGCTMGHWHVEDSPEPRVQEVYEFQSHGLLVLDREDGEVEVWVARDGDKVSVPNACHMTLYNLGDEDQPLITLDFANPDRNVANKNAVEQFGPILLACYDTVEVVFTLNRLYINNPLHGAGVRLPTMAGDLRNRQVRFPRIGRLDLGAFLYESLTQDPDVIGRFARLNLHLQTASQEGYVRPLAQGTAPRLYFSRALVQAVRSGTELYRYFDDNVTPTAPGKGDSMGIVGRQSEAARRKTRLGRAKLSENPRFVVEGAGSWVTDAYRPAFEQVASSRPISVIYADDTRWAAAPDWTSRLLPHEVYLDKSHPGDFALYNALGPDVAAVFIGTPDFTHCAIARSWVERAAPLVFIEKPFDSQLRNVDALFDALGRKPVTTVLGLDHYRFRALEIQAMLPEIARHLDGALARVSFYMTETQPLELGRIRTLQFGLTMDLLPHLLALLAFFGDVATVDDIRILEAGRYGPVLKATQQDEAGNTIEEDVSSRFLRETYSHVRFTFEDYSGNGYRVPCTAVVGKGFRTTTKFLEVTGRNGNAVRVEFGGSPTSGPAAPYHWGHIMFLHGERATATPRAHVADPHQNGRELRIGAGERPVEQSKDRYYQALIEDLMNGTRKSFGATLLPAEAWDIVRALDRVWWAIHGFCDEPGWATRPLQQADPIDLAIEN